MEKLYNFYETSTNRFLMTASLAFFSRIAHVRPEGILRLQHDLNKSGVANCCFNGRGIFPDCQIRKNDHLALTKEDKEL